MKILNLDEKHLLSGPYDEVGADYANVFISKRDLLKAILPDLKRIEEEANYDPENENFSDYLEKLVNDD